MAEWTKRFSRKALQTILRQNASGGRRSPLYKFMRTHHATLKAEFDAYGPNWPARAVLFGKAGIMDRTGKPPTVRTAQQTWYRLCAEMDATKVGMAKLRKGSGKARPGAVPPEAPAPAAPATSHGPALDDGAVRLRTYNETEPPVWPRSQAPFAARGRYPSSDRIGPASAKRYPLNPVLEG